MFHFITGILFLASFLLASENISVGHKKKIFSIQLFSIKRTLSKKAIISTIPRHLQNKVHLHKTTNGVTVALYSQTSNRKSIHKDLKKVRKAGYKKAYIITQRSWWNPQQEKVKETQNKTPKLSKYVISQMITKANRAYKNANEPRAMIYYEMLIASGVKSEKIKNNLCYLYGKIGAWPQAKDIIDKEAHSSRLIYAYANGAVNTLQKNFYNDMSKYIILDRSGHLALLAGYYFEQNNDKKKSFEFYKMAYEKNRSDLYNVYAYARFLDILGKKSDAMKLYIDVYKRTNTKDPRHKALYLRLYQ